jgi:hypothetical protein
MARSSNRASPRTRRIQGGRPLFRHQIAHVKSISGAQAPELPDGQAGDRRGGGLSAALIDGGVDEELRAVIAGKYEGMKGASAFALRATADKLLIRNYGALNCHAPVPIELNALAP